jgi:hypothetical protein
MNTTAAATEAHVTVATIRTWCRIGAVAAVKQAGRWIIDTASLAARIAIGAIKARKEHRMTATPQPDPATARELIAEINMSVAQAVQVDSVPGLRSLLAYVEARDIAAFVDPEGVHPTEEQWNTAAAYITSQISHLNSEARTNASIYDYE